MTTPAPVILTRDETQIAEFHPDKTRYWRDNGIMAVGLMALAGVFLWAIGSPYPAIGSLGAILAVGVRAFYLASETLNMRWVLTNRRLILPSGVHSINLMEIEKARRLLGDVQVISTTGDKHLLKHMADADAVIATLLAAREKRAKRRG